LTLFIAQQQRSLLRGKKAGGKYLGGFNPLEKYATVKMGSSSPRFGMKLKKIFELPPPRSTVAIEPA